MRKLWSESNAAAAIPAAIQAQVRRCHVVSRPFIAVPESRSNAERPAQEGKRLAQQIKGQAHLSRANLGGPAQTDAGQFMPR